jgi:glycosyltransferase involved in cell wall biosynthesis
MRAVRSDRRSRDDVVLVQTVVPDYRTSFVDCLRERLGKRFILLSGTEDWTHDIRHMDAAASVGVRNRYFARRRLLWQSGAVRRAISAEVTVLPLNPRIVSSWVVLVARRIRSRRTLLWGHAWPRKGRATRSEPVRGLMRRLAGSVIVYTEQEARQLREQSRGLDVTAAPNAIYRRHEIVPADASQPTTDFLFVGRLTNSKKPVLLLEAFELARAALPSDVRLVFIGEGPQFEEVRERVVARGLENRVLLLGHVSDVGRLRKAYGKAIAAVSPGYVGLSLIQSLGNGVPMLVARDEPHAPEVEAIVEGENGWFFDSDSPDALGSRLVEIARQRAIWASRRNQISDNVRSTYTVEQMVDRFVAALRVIDRGDLVAPVGPPIGPGSGNP